MSRANASPVRLNHQELHDFPDRYLPKALGRLSSTSGLRRFTHVARHSALRSEIKKDRRGARRTIGPNRCAPAREFISPLAASSCK
jgi:hypothetical protein